jgi:hypothetical protein
VRAVAVPADAGEVAAAASITARFATLARRDSLAGRTMFVLALGILALTVALTAYRMLTFPPGVIGIDLDTYMDAARSWLRGDAFYLSRQLNGPYQIESGDVLYPPVTLWLFVPFVYLPAVLWWLIPIGLTVSVLASWRPHPAGLLVAALLLAVPYSRETIWWGNPIMWSVAAVAWGFELGWPGPFALLKPSLFPFALAGINRRGWWAGLVVLIAIAIPFGAMWLDWVRVVIDSGGGPAYSRAYIPIMLIPVVVWVSRARGTSANSDPI